MKIVCHCFNYTDTDIHDDVLKNEGRSFIEQRIAESKKGGTCQCELKNPQRRCCLADVHREVEEARRALSS